MISPIALATALFFLIAADASAQEDHVVYFQQDEPPDVGAWEFEILEDRWVPVDLTGSLVDPCETCWKMDIPLPQAGWIRARSIGVDGEVSAWSPIPIAAPEPSSGVSIAIGVLALALARRL